MPGRLRPIRLLAPITSLWWRLWRWCYPHAAPILDPVVPNESNPHRGWRQSTAFLLRLPLLARAQAAAERNPRTRSHGQPGHSSALPSGAYRPREIAIAVLGLGWTVSFLAIAVSTVVTGNFLFEYAPTPSPAALSQEEIVSPYFRVAAAAAVLPLALAALILSGSWLRSRLR